MYCPVKLSGMQIIPGKIQKLPVFEAVEKGYMLGDESHQVFIPRRELKPATEPGTEIEVFVYYNEERNIEATTQLPQIQLGEVGCFRVGNANDLGSFVSIGSKRDILIPNKEQVESLEEGRMTLLILLDDSENKRLYGSTKLNRHFRNQEVPYQRGDEITMMIAEKIEIGRRVIIDGKYIGALFRQEMTDKVRLGEKVKGFVRKVEGKDIIVSMQREGMELLDDSKAKILSYLELNGGYVRLNDDTDPEEIKLRLHMSKKAFKKAAGMLFKEGKVLLTKFGIKINKTGELPKDWERNKILVEEEMDGSVPVKKEARAEKSERPDDESPKRDYAPREKRPYEKKSYPPREDKPRYSERPRPSHDDEPREKPPRRSDDTPREPAPVKKQLTFKGKK